MKYEVGDSVRVVSGLRVGMVGVVAPLELDFAPSDDTVYLLAFEGGQSGHYRASQLELAPKQEAPAKEGPEPVVLGNFGGVVLEPVDWKFVVETAGRIVSLTNAIIAVIPKNQYE